MTVVLALRCADGLVMGSVSQITDPGRGLSYPAQKLHMMGKRAAWGGSGSGARRTRCVVAQRRWADGPVSYHPRTGPITSTQPKSMASARKSTGDCASRKAR
ncbi:hypothetical protein ABQE44_25000 [Mycolicibacterium sp. XJ2546]